MLCKLCVKDLDPESFVRLRCTSTKCRDDEEENVFHEQCLADWRRHCKLDKDQLLNIPCPRNALGVCAEGHPLFGNPHFFFCNGKSNDYKLIQKKEKKKGNQAPTAAPVAAPCARGLPSIKSSTRNCLPHVPGRNAATFEVFSRTKTLENDGPKVSAADWGLDDSNQNSKNRRRARKKGAQGIDSVHDSSQAYDSDGSPDGSLVEGQQPPPPAAPQAPAPAAGTPGVEPEDRAEFAGLLAKWKGILPKDPDAALRQALNELNDKKSLRLAEKLWKEETAAANARSAAQPPPPARPQPPPPRPAAPHAAPGPPPAPAAPVVLPAFPGVDPALMAKLAEAQAQYAHIKATVDQYPAEQQAAYPEQFGQYYAYLTSLTATIAGYQQQILAQAMAAGIGLQNLSLGGPAPPAPAQVAPQETAQAGPGYGLVQPGPAVGYGSPAPAAPAPAATAVAAITGAALSFDSAPASPPTPASGFGGSGAATPVAREAPKERLSGPPPGTPSVKALQLCKLCWRKKAKYMTHPCSHFALCAECFETDGKTYKSCMHRTDKDNVVCCMKKIETLSGLFG